MTPWERSVDEIQALGYSYGFVKVIDALEGEYWQVDASKGGERWVVKAATLDEAFQELRAKCAPASRSSQLVAKRFFRLFLK